MCANPASCFFFLSFCIFLKFLLLWWYCEPTFRNLLKPWLFIFALLNSCRYELHEFEVKKRWPVSRNFLRRLNNAQFSAPWTLKPSFNAPRKHKIKPLLHSFDYAGRTVRRVKSYNWISYLLKLWHHIEIDQKKIYLSDAPGFKSLYLIEKNTIHYVSPKFCCVNQQFNMAFKKILICSFQHKKFLY